MDPQPDLTIVVPVYNAAASIEELVSRCLSLGELATEVLLVDDSSTDGSTELVRDLALRHQNVSARYHEVNRGAGVSRNQAFEDARGRYTLFFDADDVLHGDAVTRAVPLLDESGADVAFMPYRYRRARVVRHEAMNDFDERVWRDIAGGESRVVRLGEVSALLGFSNYPWNKIIRTDVYRRAGLRFGETIVHNDILGHWYVMLFARRILLVDQVVCTHIVEEGGGNLSNRQSAVRLALFDALDETYDLIESNPQWRNRYSHHYWSLVLRTAGWAVSRISADYLDEFNLRLQEHLLRMNLSDFARIRMKRSPRLANELIRKALA